MKKVILTYGLIAGVIVSLMMVITQPLFRNGTITLDNGVYVGFTTMIISMALIFFGIRTFRDQHLGGSITFGKAFSVGILIAVIASLMYAITWEFVYNLVYPDFAEWYQQCQIDKLEKEGATSAEISQARVELASFGEMYKNPFIRFGFTLIEIFPVGLIITLISAAVLRKKEILPA